MKCIYNARIDYVTNARRTTIAQGITIAPLWVGISLYGLIPTLLRVSRADGTISRSPCSGPIIADWHATFRTSGRGTK